MVTASAGLCGAVFGLIAEHAGLSFVFSGTHAALTCTVFS